MSDEDFDYPHLDHPFIGADQDEINLLMMSDEQMPNLYVTGKGKHTVVLPMFYGTAPETDYGDNNAKDPEENWDEQLRLEKS